MLIDSIFTSNTEKVTYNDVVEIGVSDHYMIVASWGNIKQKCDSHKYLITHNTSKLDVQEFQAELASVNWDEVYKEKDTEIAYEKFMNKFRPILDRHAPLRKRRVKQNNDIPWLNKDVKDMMKHTCRDSLKKKATVRPLIMQPIGIFIANHEIRLLYSTLHRLKTEYIQNTCSVKRNSGDSGKIWKTLRCVIPNKRGDTSIHSIKVEGVDIKDDMEFANSFNEYFTNYCW